MGSLLILILLAGAAYYLYGAYFQGSSMVQGEFVISYADGTTKTYLVGPFQTSLAVAVSGSTVPINNIAFVVKATPTWTGSPTTLTGVSWGVVGKVSVDGVQKQVIGTPSGLPTSIASGTTYTISTTNLTGTTLDVWIPFDYNAHTLSVDVSVQCIFVPPNESAAKSVEGAATGSIALKDIGFPVLLSVTMSNTVS
jgi:hypothetical protein